MAPALQKRPDPLLRSPGSEAVSSLTLRVRGNQGDPGIGLLEAGTCEQV